MARSALGWSVRELCERAELGTATVTRFENGGDVYAGTLEKIEAVLEAEGIRFGKDEGGGLWVYLTPELVVTQRKTRG